MERFTHLELEISSLLLTSSFIWTLWLGNMLLWLLSYKHLPQFLKFSGFFMILKYTIQIQIIAKIDISLPLRDY